MDSKDIDIAIHEHAVPPAVEADMERLYQNLYATVEHHRMHGGIDSTTSVYVARKDGRAVAALLFRRDGEKVRVLNEQMRMDAEEIGRFARCIFARYADVNLISFHAVDAGVDRLPFPCQRFNCTEDIVLALPSSADAYRASLGKATRSYINRYLNKLRRDFPSLRHDVYLPGQVSEQQIRSIIALNTERMTGKSRQSYIDDAEAARIVHFAQTRGLVSVITIDGRLCAGAINFRIGDHFFLKVIAHDPAYNDYRLGTLCCYLGICECIARGGAEYHFLWGRYEYKYRLLGVQRDLSHVMLYRSRAQMMFNGGTAIRMACAGIGLRARSWLLERLKQDGGLGRSLRLTATALQRLRGKRRPPHAGATGRTSSR